jgi:soluble lytic murein transglycosylase-like protein
MRFFPNPDDLVDMRYLWAALFTSCLFAQTLGWSSNTDPFEQPKEFHTLKRTNPCRISAREVERLIRSAAKTHRVSANLIREVARQESDLNPCAVSRRGARGLMQLTRATWVGLGVKNPLDAQQNVMAGARLLRRLLKRYDGDVSLALSAYNAGPGRVDEAEGMPHNSATRAYVEQILRRLEN